MSNAQREAQSKASQDELRRRALRGLLGPEAQIEAQQQLQERAAIVMRGRTTPEQLATFDRNRASALHKRLTIRNRQLQIASVAESAPAPVYEECSLCFDPLGPVRRLTRFPCNPRHIIHTDDLYMVVNGRCPLCRAEFQTNQLVELPQESVLLQSGGRRKRHAKKTKKTKKTRKTRNKHQRKI